MNNTSLINETSDDRSRKFRSNIDLWALWHAQTGVYSTFIIIGLSVNLWFLLAILTSAKLRARLRNKLLSGLLLAHLLDTAVVIPLFLTVERIYRYRPRTGHNCLIRSFFWNLSTIQNIIANSTIVIIVALFLARSNKLDLSRHLSRNTRKVLTCLIPCLPWVGAILFIGVIQSKTVLQDDNLCVYIDKSKTLIWKSAEAAIPLVCALVLVFVAAAQRCWRMRSKADETVMAAELIGREAEKDEKVLPYAVMVCVALVLDIPNMCRYMALPFESFDSRVYFAFSSHVMVCAQSVVMPFVLLLLDYFRDRIKTWRLWHCSNNHGELNVGYCSNNSDTCTVGYSQAIA